MCGIVAAISNHNIIPTLIQGLQRLEYRGYDSCGIAYLSGKNNNHEIKRLRTTTRVSALNTQAQQEQLTSNIGIAHTRWATHGAPIVDNAHPHVSYGNPASNQAQIAIVHNGIIENFAQIKQQLIDLGYEFNSDTDSEVIAHLISYHYQGDLFSALKQSLTQLTGAYSIAAFCVTNPQQIVGARLGSPLVLGVSDNKLILASDAVVLAGVSEQVIYLEDNDIVNLQQNNYYIEQMQQQNFVTVTRELKPVTTSSNQIEIGNYQHFMQKEIFEQPAVLADTLEGINGISANLFGNQASEIFDRIDNILILACGTSYYSGCCAKYWLEDIAKIPTQVEIASEYRYRNSIANPKTLVITISQSGETADTISALKHAKRLGMLHTLSICNVAASSMVRESKLAYITRAGIEIGVASTKAFTTQLAALFLFTLTIAKQKNNLTPNQEQSYLKLMRHLPSAIQQVLDLESQIINWAQQITLKDNVLFLGRGLHYPIALEGALKLKEISYIHAEAYPAGELKHGPLALVTSKLPVIVVAPNDELIEKLVSNMQEVSARGGVLYVLADSDTKVLPQQNINLIRLPEHYGQLSPILHVIPLQLLAYHCALIRNNDIDKPRNLAKSVTVE